VFLPEDSIFCVLSFEGPDLYSQSGGLATRAKDLVRALAGRGFETHLFFTGDPNLAPIEDADGVRYHRWSQWLSRLYPGGVYEAEAAKVLDWNQSLPAWLVDQVIQPAASQGRRVVVLAEEWQTAVCVQLLDAALRARGLRPWVVMLWNANNLYGFERLDFTALEEAATLTTVSRYMKHRMWQWRVNPIVIPNGIPSSALTAPKPAQVAAIRRAAGPGFFGFKIGRFDPDKRWLMAMDALAMIKRGGRPVKLLVRGGRERHGAQVLAHARSQGLATRDLPSPSSWRQLVQLLGQHSEVEVLNLVSFLPEELLPPIYAAADAVLANSGHEPFGLVGLEVMAAGGLAVTGSTGEDYAQGYRNAIVLETDDAIELAAELDRLEQRPEWGRELRRRGRATAREFIWETVLEELFDRIDLAARRQGVAASGQIGPAGP